MPLLLSTCEALQELLWHLGMRLRLPVWVVQGLKSLTRLPYDCVFDRAQCASTKPECCLW